LEKLGLNLGYILVQIICFLLLFVVLRAWVYKPMLTLLDKRRQKLADGLEDARVAAEARASAEKDAAAIVAEAQTKAAHIISQATERADAAMIEVRADADNQIAKEREATLVEVEEERNRMLGDLRGQVAALAVAATQKLVGDVLDEKRQHALLSEFFSGVKSGKAVVLESASINGDAAEVVSALPLTDVEQAAVKNDVLAKMGSGTKVEFKVDPSILGGLIIRVGDKVLDGSVAGQLDDLRQSLR
jgi:F-type H+-transporting ATPase subunit b